MFDIFLVLSLLFWCLIMKCQIQLEMKVFESLNKLKEKTEVLAINMGDVNQLKQLPDLAALVQIYGNSPDHQELVAQALFGGISIKGMLPKTLSET